MLGILCSLAFAVPAADPLAFQQGDRIVWLGSTLVEREQRYGYWETALACRHPNSKLSFRNLGWSGDTVFGDARAGFDSVEKGYERLVSLTDELKPTVIFVSYGTNESFAGEKGLEPFRVGLNKLLTRLESTKARIVLFTPAPFEVGPGFPNPKVRNDELGAYAKVIREVADSRGHRFADLYSHLLQHQGSRQTPLFTDNGMHFSQAGYQSTIPDFLTVMGRAWPAEDPKAFEKVRRAVVKKNELFFHRWRPQNETYLFGFRKHEQGKNAKEIVEFDPLIEAAEDEVFAALKEISPPAAAPR